MRRRARRPCRCWRGPSTRRAALRRPGQSTPRWGKRGSEEGGGCFRIMPVGVAEDMPCVGGEAQRSVAYSGHCLPPAGVHARRVEAGFIMLRHVHLLQPPVYLRPTCGWQCARCKPRNTKARTANPHPRFLAPPTNTSGVRVGQAFCAPPPRQRPDVLRVRPAGQRRHGAGGGAAGGAGVLRRTQGAVGGEEVVWGGVDGRKGVPGSVLLRVQRCQFLSYCALLRPAVERRRGG